MKNKFFKDEKSNIKSGYYFYKETDYFNHLNSNQELVLTADKLSQVLNAIENNTELDIFELINKVSLSNEEMFHLYEIVNNKLITLTDLVCYSTVYVNWEEMGNKINAYMKDNSLPKPDKSELIQYSVEHSITIEELKELIERKYKQLVNKNVNIYITFLTESLDDDSVTNFIDSLKRTSVLYTGRCTGKEDITFDFRVNADILESTIQLIISQLIEYNLVDIFSSLYLGFEYLPKNNQTIKTFKDLCEFKINDEQTNN